MPSGGGVSWPNYIPQHPSYGFTGYALPLSGILRPAFGSDFRCKRNPRLILRS